LWFQLQDVVDLSLTETEAIVSHYFKDKEESFLFYFDLLEAVKDVEERYGMDIGQFQQRLTLEFRKFMITSNAQEKYYAYLAKLLKVPLQTARLEEIRVHAIEICP